MGKKILQFLLLATTLLGGWWILTNQYVLSDWVALRNYTPPQYVVGFADDTSMTAYARRVFYVTKPQLSSGEEFNLNCPVPEKSLVIGCYAAGRIHIFDVVDPRLKGVEEVTAAHEMLHAVHTRFSSSEKQILYRLLDEQMTLITSPRILSLLEIYRAHDISTIHNEMHSIFGTEVAELLPELEEHYLQFFYDRSRVIAISESYEQVFSDINNSIEKLDQEIAVLRTQISQQENTITALGLDVNAQSDRLEALRAAGDIPAYNAGVPAFNTLVANYNSLLDGYEILISRHNSKVEARNSQAITKNELIQGLDSKFEKL